VVNSIRKTEYPISNTEYPTDEEKAGRSAEVKFRK
jgi:hypothetical protein